jgi:hypothetical protein
MTRIEWKSLGAYGEGMKVGNIVLYLIKCYGRNKGWYSDVSIREIASTKRYGPIRKSKTRAKEDAIRLAKELLIDYHTGIVAEMKNFDLIENE